MIDIKPLITQVLRKDATLVDLLGGEKIWSQVVPVHTMLPYLTLFELTNFNIDYADNKALRSEIHLQVDIWATGSTSQLALATNRIMEELVFVRTSSIDGYDPATKAYRKILRYKTRR